MMNENKADSEDLSVLIERGGIFRDIKGTTPLEALGDLAPRLSLPPSLQAEALLKAVLEREALMPTGVGHGIALPHPRTPLLSEAGEQFVALAFLEKPIDWKALDGNPVDKLFLIVSASAKLHLHTLSKINYFCQQADFLKLLQEKSEKSFIIEHIRKAEEAWR
jgi:PTS system nitrogen regulatory IIA component